jgi:hypothetical protein
MNATKPLFSLGRVVSTTGALEAFKATGEDPLAFLVRHSIGDWGEVDSHDEQENELSVKQGFRILSVYRLKDGTKFWIITEADRSYTTYLLPEEY